LTAIGEKVNEMTSPLYGADAYVDKPFDFSELETKIKEVLAQRAKLS
jgi:DNA-binding response OmpR family regulator